MGISDRGTEAKTITSCDNGFVTNIVLARETLQRSEAAHRTPPGSSALRESNNKAPNRNKNQPHVMMMNYFLGETFERLSDYSIYFIKEESSWNNG
ncbi:hypothetical protein ACZ11_14845 [Lysinibacillus xylanilyticus]|uniref:Uncharacterized protein n=1 Tax=Lysinibacillus xylanilyticus TaxID=582475 RepID=A0A0K9F834_9BACI|nr:hypothetical protein ACZ11_14845 [Lysinibacillus xylanilyticus]